MGFVVSSADAYLKDATANVPMDGSSDKVCMGCWMRDADVPGGDRWFFGVGSDTGTTSGNKGGMTFANYNPGADARVWVHGVDDNGAQGIVTYADQHTDTDWHHFLAIYDTSVPRLSYYYDGVKRGTDDTVIAYPPADPLVEWVIGRAPLESGGTDLENGAIAEVFVFASTTIVPTQAQITALQTQQPRAVFSTGLLHYDSLYGAMNGPYSVRAGVVGAGALATVGGTPVFDPTDHPPTVSGVGPDGTGTRDASVASTRDIAESVAI